MKLIVIVSMSGEVRQCSNGSKHDSHYWGIGNEYFCPGK